MSENTTAAEEMLADLFRTHQTNITQQKKITKRIGRLFDLLDGEVN